MSARLLFFKISRSRYLQYFLRFGLVSIFIPLSEINSRRRVVSISGA